jgi:single-stranded-DNA-specific exonuclease
LFIAPQKRWLVGTIDISRALELERLLGCSTLTARLLVRRGLTEPETADRFLRADWDQLPDPFLLPDAERAVERIRLALHEKQRILVHGDYDCDGVTSAALYARLLRRLGGNVDVHVPHRHKEGYDLRAEVIERARQSGVQLIITTDCGIQRVEEVEAAAELGIDVVVTDHHEPGPRLPRAVAVVNPHRRDSRYPFSELAGVGVAFRLGEALVRHLGMPVDAYRRAYSDLAALGTVADMMPLVEDNRIIVRHGLVSLAETKKVGLSALLKTAMPGSRSLSAQTIGYAIGPRLNAIGRMDDAGHALQLLMTTDPNEAALLVQRLEAANTERRIEQFRVFDEAVEQACMRDLASERLLVLHGHGWNAGVVGLVAGKIVERFHRPAILIAVHPETGRGRGSARSIRPFHMLDAITQWGEMLEEFGGHSHAAGFSIDPAKIEEFAAAMRSTASAKLTDEDLVPELKADFVLDPHTLDAAAVRELSRMEPFGRGNEPPMLVARGLHASGAMRFGKEQNHLRCRLSVPGEAEIESVLWGGVGRADRMEEAGALDICYQPEIHQHAGQVYVRLVIHDICTQGRSQEILLPA